MISKDLTKRVITSVPLLLLLVFSFSNSIVLTISLTIVSLISWIEFNSLISKIFIKKNYKIKFYKIFKNFLSFIYLTLFSFLIFSGISQDNYKLLMFFLFSICISSDIGGLLFGKFFKGRKLTKISPNKTISGAIGSIIFSCLSITPLIYFYAQNNSIIIIFSAIVTSIACQFGDLFFSYLKRKAKVKDTGKLLPGHGGILDRIDSVLIGLPFGLLTLTLFFQ